MTLPGLALACALAAPALAWNEKGHGLVAETAARLLEQQPGGWGSYLSSQTALLRAYSYYPDHPFRDIGGELEGPNHYFHLDAVSADMKEALRLPSDCRRARSLLSAKLGREKALAAGTVPWRIEQFHSLARGELARARGEKADPGRLRKAVYFLGLMSHYTADIFVPYHGREDSDGALAGHPGMHGFIEDCADRLEGRLAPRVLARARGEFGRILKERERMDSTPVPRLALRALRRSVGRARAFEALDARGPRAESCPSFEPLLVERLAAASAFTAYMFARSLPAGARPPERPSPPADSELDRTPEYPEFQCAK